jgi:hypothetical protein
VAANAASTSVRWRTARIHQALYEQYREQAQREASPAAAIIDSQVDDLQWSSIKGGLPGRKRRGPRWVDDRRVISGIIRRIATRYDKCADNFLSAVCLIGAIYFWLN